jgi:hypothetical protein
MRKFRRRVVTVIAEQWHPDPTLGAFAAGDYQNRAIGRDALGVEYLVTEVGYRTPRGFMRISPGDWIVTDGLNSWVVEQDSFVKLYEPTHRPGE